MNEQKFFPSTRTEALAMAYVQSRDISGMSPENICRLYWRAYHRISVASATINKEEYKKLKLEKNQS